MTITGCDNNRYHDILYTLFIALMERFVKVRYRWLKMLIIKRIKQNKKSSIDKERKQAFEEIKTGKQTNRQTD